ncbi:MAG: hypothetical protein HC851_00310 [Acaryochloris sp. RU_4_1]|nr:hypothetical protein [Acaryochloris sp. RU_4_1]NJR53241.1 hypothetical protein [Acaryochloris sp. CRU_2_0]
MPEEQPIVPQSESDVPGSASSTDPAQGDLQATSAANPPPQPKSESLRPSVWRNKPNSEPSASRPSSDQTTEAVAQKIPSPPPTSKPRPDKPITARTSSSLPETQPIGSTIESTLTQVWIPVSKAVGSLFSTVQKQVVASKLYSNLQARLKPLQPIVQVFTWIWKQILIPLGNKVVKPLWGLGLKFLRGRFPEALKPFSDRFLTLVILSILLIGYWLFSSVTAAIKPAVQTRPQTQPVVTVPKPVKPVPVTLAPVSPSPPQPASPTAEAPTSEPPSPPQPEQKPIMDVQTQVAQVVDRYSQDVVQSVQANFQAEQWVVKVSDRWFDLTPTEQDQLGKDVLERSRQLNFPKLEIRDQTDKVLAREPVVGSNIIVLHRRPPASSESTTDNPA